MAALTGFDCSAHKMNTVAATILSASDTYTYKPGDLLILRNVTAGALTPVMNSDTDLTLTPKGLGIVTATSVSAQSIAAGASKSFFADTAADLLRGTVTITAGDGISFLIIRRG